MRSERLPTKAGGIDQTGKQEIAPPRCAHDSEVRDIRVYGNCGEMRGEAAWRSSLPTEEGECEIIHR